MSSKKLKCGYCGWVVWLDQKGQFSAHDCFGNCTDFVMDNDGNLFRNETAANEKENVADNLEECHDTENLDEDLISAVKDRPALYDFRMPVKERGKKQKDCLWQEVSECLKGLYTATEAEKRWTYLKDCYRKARNMLIRKQNIAQKSGAAGIPKNLKLQPSFRHYDVMTFLNDTLAYRQTVSSLQKSLYEKQASSSNSNNSPSTSTRDNFNMDDVRVPIIDNSNSISPVSPSSSNPKRKKIDNYEEALIKSLTHSTEPNPIDGFVSRLAEGLRRLSYKSRSKLEIEFLSRLHEMQEEDERYGQ